MFFVYILKSLRVQRYYVGHTSDLEKRLKEHNTGRTKSTKAYAPWKVVHLEEFNTKSEAFKRELEIKSFRSGIKFKKLVNLERWPSG